MSQSGSSTDTSPATLETEATERIRTHPMPDLPPPINSRATGDLGPRDSARYWRDPVRDGLELLRATFVTHVFPRHTHEESFVIGAIERGVQSCHTRGSHNYFPAGTVVLLNPGIMHSGAAFDGIGYTYRALYPDVARMQALGRQMGLALRDDDLPVFRAPYAFHDPLLARRLFTLHANLEEEAHTGSRLRQDSLLLATVGDLLRAYGEVRPLRTLTAPGGETDAIRRARGYLDEHATENVSLETLAAVAGLSPWHLLRVFRDAVGVPPHAYQTQLRIERAKALLGAGLPIAQAAAAVGLVDQSHLTHLFKRLYGVTPGAFQKDSNFLQAALPRGAIV